MKIAYVRVSTVEQNEARQIEALEKFGVEKWFTEKISAKDTNRPQLRAMLDFAREGDTIYIHDFSRLARSTKDLLDIGLVNKYYDLALAGDAIAANHYTKLSVKADACLQCGHCEKRCPFGVKQMTRMKNIHQYFSKETAV